MRSFFLFSFLCISLALSAQPQQFVWARSGLSMRATGTAGGQKVLTIPYGAEVTLTGNTGEIVEVPTLPNRQYPAAPGNVEDMRSHPYAMTSKFVEVRYEGQTGFAYGAYLFRIPPPRADNQDFWLPEWLRNHAGAGTTIRNYPGMKDTETIVYPSGLVFAKSRAKGNRTFSLSIPHATLDQGFVIADRFWDMEQAIRDFNEEEDHGEDFWYTILKRDIAGNLLFQNGMGDVNVRKGGDFLVISFVDRW